MTTFLFCLQCRLAGVRITKFDIKIGLLVDGLILIFVATIIAQYMQ